MRQLIVAATLALSLVGLGTGAAAAQGHAYGHIRVAVCHYDGPAALPDGTLVPAHYTLLLVPVVSAHLSGHHPLDVAPVDGVCPTLPAPGV